MNLVIGGSGGLGLAITRELLAQGQTVTATYNHTDKSLAKMAHRVLQTAALDVRNPVGLQELVNKAHTVYFCLNVPYQHWYTVMPQALGELTGLLNASQQLVFPGNVYGYGPFQFLPADENHPKAASTRKGQLRNRLEAMIEEQAMKQGFRYVIPRYPDYYGPNVTNRAFGPIFTGALQSKALSWPAALNVMHDLVYIRDAARAAVLLAESGEQGEWHIAGSGALTGEQFLNLVQEEANVPRQCRALKGWMIGLAGLFDKEAREFHELLYEFRYPLLLNEEKFRERFPAYRPTDHHQAVKETLEWFREEGV